MLRDRLSPIDKICERLRDTREAISTVSQAEYAREAGISERAYGNYENGYRIGIDGAIALCNTYELSLDWIYFGETANLSDKIVRQLRAYEKKKATETNSPAEDSAGSARPLKKARSSHSR